MRDNASVQNFFQGGANIIENIDNVAETFGNARNNVSQLWN